MAEPQIIAEVRSQDGWDGLLEAFRLAFDELNTSYRVIDDIAGLADGHASKLFAPIRLPRTYFGSRIFGPVMGALGVKILVVVDEDARAWVRAHKRFQPRGAGPTRHTSGTKRAANAKKRRSQFMPPDKARMLQSRWFLLTTANQRKAWARQAAQARWRKPQVVEVKGHEAEKLRATSES